MRPSSPLAPRGYHIMGCSQSSPAVQSVVVNDPSLAADTNAVIDFKPCHSAVRWNKLGDLQNILKNAKTVNVQDTGNGNYPIHIAAQNGHIDIVNLLIKHKCEINSKNGKGNTALHMAIGYDYYDCATAIIKAGGDLNMVNDAGVPASRGLEGDKTLSLIEFMAAKTAKEAVGALKNCETDVAILNKVVFVSTGLKLKKSLENNWTDSMQTQFKRIIDLIPK